MQSDGNSFSGYVVLDSFNKASWYGDNIIDRKYVRIIFMVILILHNIQLECILIQQQ